MLTVGSMLTGRRTTQKKAHNIQNTAKVLYPNDFIITQSVTKVALLDPTILWKFNTLDGQ
jgi:hypothetical protein